MEDLILNISDVSRLIIYAALAVLIFLGYVWFFVKLNTLRIMSKRFIASSKKENFEGGRKLNRKVRSLFALAMLLDVIMLFVFQPVAIVSNAWASAIVLAITAVQIGAGLPIIVRGTKAEARFRNLYPPVPKVEVFKHTGQQNEEDFFEVAETQKQAEVVASDTPKKETMPEDTDEIIEYDDNGYIGAWRLEKSDTDTAEEKEPEEEVKTKECPFCGTLNGIDNRVCDFCGADISEQEE